MTSLSIAMCSPLAWRENFVLALPPGVVLVSLLTSGVLLDRTTTERLLTFRPRGLLRVAVEFSAPLPSRPVRGTASPG